MPLIPGLADYNKPVINDSGETIPPYAVMEVTGWETVDDRRYAKVVKPTGEGKVYLINGRFPLNADGRKKGMATDSWGARVLYKVESESEEDDGPEVGEIWGPVANQWYIDSQGGKFAIVGDASGEGEKSTVRVATLGGGGDAVIVLAFKEIPEATINNDNVIDPGVEDVWLAKRGPVDGRYEPETDEAGEKVTRKLYNFSLQALATDAGKGGEPPSEGDPPDKPIPMAVVHEGDRLVVRSGQGESTVEAGNENLAILTLDLTAAENSLEVIDEENVSGELKLGFSENMEPPDGPGYNALLLARKYASEPIPFIEDWDKIYYVPEAYSAVTLFGFVTAGTRRGKVVRFSYHGDPVQKVGIIHAEDCGI